MTTSNQMYASVIAAIERHDLRGAITMLEKLLIPDASRELGEVGDSIAQCLAGHGRSIPYKLNSAKNRPLLRKAVIGLTGWMEQYDIKTTPTNRYKLVKMVCGYVVEDLDSIETDGYESETASRINDFNIMPAHQKVMRLLASPVRITAAVNACFPGYLSSGLLSMWGIEYKVANPKTPPEPENHQDHKYVTSGFQPPAPPLSDEEEAEKEELKNAMADALLREKTQERLRAATIHPPAPAGYAAQPLYSGLNPDGPIADMEIH